MTETELRTIVARNIAHYRRELMMTQIQLAERLNYSDKSVSKWERGEALPDLVVLCNIAHLFGLTPNDLVSERRPKNLRRSGRNRHLIPIMAAVGVWAVATAVFALLGILIPDPGKSWLAFIYAIPVSLTVLAVFYRFWGRRLFVFLFASATLWTLALSVFLSFSSSMRQWLFFIAVIPLQILLVLWLLLRPHPKAPIAPDGASPDVLLPH